MNAFVSFWRDEVSNKDKKLFLLCLKLTYVLFILLAFAGNTTGKVFGTLLILIWVGVKAIKSHKSKKVKL